MHLLNTFLNSLFKLSKGMRLMLVVLLYLLCLVLLLNGFPAQLNGSLFALPVALAVWLFKGRGALFSIGATVLVFLTINTVIAGGKLWSLFLINNFLVGIVALLVEAGVIGYLRYGLEVMKEAQMQAERAEAQRSIAYEQRIKALQEKQQIVLAYEQQQQVNLLKDQFLKNVTHELRTPLTEVNGYLELLLHHYGTLNDEIERRFLHNAMNGCSELVHLVNNIVDTLALAEYVEKPCCQALELFQIVNEVLESFDVTIRQEYDVRIEIDKMLLVWADSRYLKRVLWHIFTNAFKYAPKQTVVMVSAQNEKKQANEEIWISVQDQGLGMPPEEIPLLFNKFVRLKRDLSGSVRGSGLGLYMCKQLVEIMAGRIWAESSGIVGQGSCVRVALPCVANKH